jgi:hypothetical protein
MGRVLAAAVVVAFGLVAAGAADADGEEDLTLRGEATAGARLYFLESPFDDDDLVGYFDQYRYIATKNDDPPWFADLFHLDLGLYRDDGTSLLRLERTTPGWDNDHALLEVDWRGLDFDFDYRRFRQQELRLFPDDTTGRYPTADDALAVQFNPDTAPDNPLGRDRTLWTRRTGFDSKLALRPEDFGAPDKGFDEIRVHTRWQQRDGRHQDRYLLDDRELGENGSFQRARFRAQRRRLDQEVHGVGGGIVITPEKLFTASLDVDFESFRENAPDRTVGGLVGTDPELGTGFDADTRARGLFVVPNTDRLTGSIRIARRIGRLSLNGSAFVTHIEQNGGKSQLQQQLDVDPTEATTWSAHFAADMPISDALSLNGFVKVASRRNGFDRDDLEKVAPPEGQVDPFVRRRRETTSRIEAVWRPRAGFLAAAGLRSRWVHRTIMVGDPPATGLEFDLQDDESETHDFYLRTNARVRRFLRLEGEIGAERSPHVAYARDLKKALYVDGRLWATFPGSVPISISAHGRARNGRNDDFELQDETGRRTKRFERLEWGYDLTLDAQPTRRISLFASWSETRDVQEYPHLRSTIPRYLGPTGLEFYRDSDIEYDSRVRHLSVGTRVRLATWLDARASTSLLWFDAEYDSDLDGRTGRRINRANEIDSMVTTVDTGLGFELPADFRIDLGYRFDDFDDQQDLDPLQLDETVHTATFEVTWRFGDEGS